MTTTVRGTTEIVAELAPAYKEWKGGEKTKNKLKDEFFDAITAELAASELGEEIAVYSGDGDQATAEAYVAKIHPFMEIIDGRENSAGTGYEFIVRERPEYKSFYIDFEGYVYGRQVAMGPSLVDEEEIEATNPDFWREITEWPNEKFLWDYFDWFNPPEGPEELIEGYYEDRKATRVLKPIADLSPLQLAKLQDYTYEGKPVVKLPAPKKVKD